MSYCCEQSINLTGKVICCEPCCGENGCDKVDKKIGEYCNAFGNALNYLCCCPCCCGEKGCGGVACDKVEACCNCCGVCVNGVCKVTGEACNYVYTETKPCRDGVAGIVNQVGALGREALSQARDFANQARQAANWTPNQRRK